MNIKKGIVFLFVRGIVLTIFVTINGYKLVNDWYTKSIKKTGEKEFSNQKIVSLVNHAVIGDVFTDGENTITELEKYVEKGEIEVEGYRYEVAGVLNGYGESAEEYQICLFGIW